MKNLQAIASAANFDLAVENSKKQSVSVKRANSLSNKTVFNSLIMNKKNVVSETSLIDFSLTLLASTCDTFHLSQVLELLRIAECKRTTVIAHVLAKNVFADILAINEESRIFTVLNSEFFATVASMSEFKQQLEKHANKLFALLDSSDSDFEQAHKQNVDFEQALALNEMTKAKRTKTLKVA